MFRPVHRPSSGTSTPKPYKEIYNKKLKGSPCITTILITLEHKIYHIKVKVKVNPTTGYEHPDGEYRYSPTLSLTSAPNGVDSHCIGSWVGPTRAGLDGCGKSRPHRNSIPGPSSPYRVSLPTELSRPIYSLQYKQYTLQKCKTNNFKNVCVKTTIR